MYTDPVIVCNEGGTSRSYVKLFYNGKRMRFYNGKALGLRCFPNKANSLEEQKRLLVQLQFELRKKLGMGWDPMEKKRLDPFQNFSLVRCITQIIVELVREDVSVRYREDLSRVGRELVIFLEQHGLKAISPGFADEKLLHRFLLQFNTSATYYMTKRRTLAGLFARMVHSGMLPGNPVHRTLRKKEVHVLNVPFPHAQLKALLSYLKEAHNPLYLCALLMYGCFLRPHREVRLLRRRHLNENCTMITLSGSENKSKRNRVIQLPTYVSDALSEHGVQNLLPEQYVLNKGYQPVNEHYFTTAWTRLKKNFPTYCRLNEGQTLYSFRHTGAVAVYNKTKDPYRVQQAMFHGSLKVTLTYLRSLGLMTKVNCRDLPDL